MKVFISVVPPGGGATIKSLEAELPTMPQVGDYMSLTTEAGGGTEDFIVKRSWWNLHQPNIEDGEAQLERAVVVAEMAYGIFSSETHKSAVQEYENQGKEAQRFEASGY